MDQPPATAQEFFDRGLSLCDAGRYDEAIVQLNEALARDPGHADAYLHRGRCHDRKADHDKAIADFSEAIRLKPDYALAYHFRGVSFGKKDDYDRALADYDRAFGLEQLVLAPWALREGVILAELARRDPWPSAEPADDPRRRRAVVDFARRHAWDEAHCRQVTGLALSLFDQTATLHRLGPAERGLLEVAGLLHDVGYAVAQSSHHKHSLYLIRNADLDGFTPRERDLIANIARYHRKALPADRHADYMALDEADRSLVRRLGALLRLADGLDADHFQVVEDVTVVDGGDHLRLELRARDVPDLDMWAAERNGDLFELEFGRRVEPVAVEVA